MEECKLSEDHKDSPDKILPQEIPSEKFCRICLDKGTKKLISPCLCSGTGKFIHESCLKKWISLKFPRLVGAQCEVCKSVYVMSIKKTYKCSAKQGIDGKSTHCYCIPASLSILATIGIVMYVLFSDLLDFQSEMMLSVIILIVCVLLTVGCFFLLIRSIYKLFVKREFKHWRIRSYKKKSDSSTKFKA
ncbi:hypothetical protein SteCoe_32504 [Stentor coeruleus]|uniref:RING-CH-type domain-containing protein n=1 Tax=Stentor coeruleus TaxID=5963 RepID=A0A1R2AZ11_9CILI|nr:hypothetical protein SteCoe_32504 [Stentor coeruleus]